MLNSNITYSTDEMRIGTTTDGKPVYRKIIKVPMTYFTEKTSAVALSTVTGTNTKEILSCSAQAHGSTNIYPLPYTLNGVEFGTWIWKFTNDGVVSFYNKVQWGSAYTLYVAIEYTK